MLRRFFPTTIVAAMLLACCDFNAKADTYSQNFNGFTNGTTNLGDDSVMAGTANIQNGLMALYFKELYSSFSKLKLNR